MATLVWLWGSLLEDGGDRGIRTPDLGSASAALSQLSYIPTGIRAGPVSIAMALPGGQRAAAPFAKPLAGGVDVVEQADHGTEGDVPDQAADGRGDAQV